MIKLLLVDDEVEFLDSMSRALSRRGFSVTHCAMPRQALTRTRKVRWPVSRFETPTSMRLKSVIEAVAASVVASA